jgi:hypothetical protein
MENFKPRQGIFIMTPEAKNDTRIRHENQIFHFSHFCLPELPANRPRMRSCRVRAHILPLTLFRDCLLCMAFQKAKNAPELKFGVIPGKIELSTGKCGLSVDKWRKRGGGEAVFGSGEGQL